MEIKITTDEQKRLVKATVIAIANNKARLERIMSWNTDLKEQTMNSTVPNSIVMGICDQINKEHTREAMELQNQKRRLEQEMMQINAKMENLHIG
tara:strand:+ start:1888 stop:2172 length:285 start_codon:yes stop_codon:yes gene_type:complete